MARFLSPITNIKPNGFLKFFKSNTNTDLITFKDERETIQNELNVPVDAAGNLPNIFFSGSAKVKYFDQFSVQYAERDPVGGEKQLGDWSSWDALVIYDKGDFVEGSDGRFYQSLSNGNQDNDPTLSPTNWQEIPINPIYNVNVTYGIGDVVQTTDGNQWKSLVTNNLNNSPSTDDGTNWIPSIDGSKIPEIITLQSDVLLFTDSGNVIVDGRFDFWFEGVSQTSSGYDSDTMWRNENTGSTKVHTQQSLVLDVDIPNVPTAEFYSRTVVTTVAGVSNFVRKKQPIESVRTLAGKTVTLSFYARADSTKDIAIDLEQVFGTGGSPSATVDAIGAQKITLGTAFTRHQVQINIPNIAGKTIGTDGNDSLALNFWFDAGSDFNSRTDTLGQQSGTFEIAAIQFEEGSVATKFEEEGQQESLSRVNRYFEETVHPDNLTLTVMQATSAGAATGDLSFVVKRSVPVLSWAAGGFVLLRSTGGTTPCTDPAFSFTSTKGTGINASGATLLVAGDATSLRTASTPTVLHIDARL